MRAAPSDLHPLEAAALREMQPNDDYTPEALAAAADLVLGQVNQVLSWLTGKGWVAETRRQSDVEHDLTGLGRSYQRDGMPEERILRQLEADGPLSLPDLAEGTGLEQREVGSAFGALARARAVRMDEHKRATAIGAAPTTLAAARRLLDAAVTGPLRESALPDDDKQVLLTLSRRRGARGPFRASDRETVFHRLTEQGAEVAAALAAGPAGGADAIGVLTPEILASGAWRERGLRPYNVETPPNRVLFGRHNPYATFLDELKDKLVSLGFQEFDGPLVETEFWNCDALFMPQFHAARDEHDVYFIKEPQHASDLPEPYFERVAATHADGWQTGSRGWGYQFDRDFARRTILRSQGTVVSAKTLTRARVPGKYFGIMRCFRPDEVDASHLADFYQTEGIVLGERVNLKTLLGLLKLFAEEVAGAASADVRYEPAYFPFTEPSVELWVKHPQLGWFELGGAGIFRPEVCDPMGVDVPVLAWGLGIDRMALLSLGLDTVRELFAEDIERVRTRAAAGRKA
jgi:phenylalanyl-tRNA synthetase alpha chain